MSGTGIMDKMTGVTTSLTLYLALLVLILSAAVVTLSVGLVRLTWRERRAGKAQDAKAAAGARDNDGSSDKRTQQAYDLSDLEEEEDDNTPHREPSSYRRTYEPVGRAAKAKRLRDGQDRQDLRLALSSLAPKGYYIFEDIVTEAGPIDYLAISRYGLHKVFVYTQEGFVWRDIPTDLVVHAEDTGEERLSGLPLPENPDIVSEDITWHLDKEIGATRTETSWTIHCFTRARIYQKSEECAEPRTLCALIDLAWSLDREDESMYCLSDARKHELADRVSEVYMREPIFRPLEVERESGR